MRILSSPLADLFAQMKDESIVPSREPRKFAGRGLTICLAMAVLAVAVTTCHATYGRVDLVNVPIARLITNLKEETAKKPKDARARLNLARVHAMAYARKTDTMQVVRRHEKEAAWFGYDPKHAPFEPVTKTTDTKTLQVAKDHLAKAIASYEEAVKLAPKNLTAHLGLAWCIDQSGDKNRAIEAYRKVAKAGWEQESKQEYGWGEGRFVSVEAGQYLRRLLDPQRFRDRQEIKLIDARAQYLMQLPRGVTPIIVPLIDEVPVHELIESEANVTFDADGSGLDRHWSWITPKAGWLVYDQHGTGEITSALQMFGNVTFMLFWESGYQALASLDDSGDGELAGAELQHLAIWQDVNNNGQSEPGEVKALAEWGIVAVNCNGLIKRNDQDVAAYAPRGVRFADGHYRPTYDIMLHSAARSPSGLAAPAIALTK